MEANAPFTKAEMLEQLRNALMLFTRSTSWVFDRDAAWRLTGWVQDERGNALCDPGVMDADEVERLDHQSFDFNSSLVYRTFEQLYDYGVLGFMPEGGDVMEGATEYSFAVSFVFDIHRSDLIAEMHNGDSCSVSHCIHTARLSIARAVLDGFDRLAVGPDDLPSDLLTISEVALLANMEERSVRNLTSGKARPDSLKTTVRDGTRYVSPEDAREWLKGRRGFNPTKTHGPLAEADLASAEFVDSRQVTDFLQQRATWLGLSYRDLFRSPTTPFSVLEPAELAQDMTQTSLIAEKLQLDPGLLNLRIQEAIATEQLTKIRKAIQQTKRRQS